MKFAVEAADFKQWESDVISTVDVTHFGFNLKEVEEFNDTLNKIDQDTIQHGDKKKTEYEHTDSLLKEFHVKDNVYTSHSTQDLETSFNEVRSALKSRRSRYDAELERQRHNDNLCKQFAKLVDPLADFIVKTKDTVATSSNSLEDQEKFVEGKIHTRDSDGASLKDIHSLAQKIKERDINHNEHTTLTVKDIEVQWEQYRSFLDNKLKQIREEIELAKLRGLTPEDLKEIEDNFRTFDKNHNNYLETNELKACLYSLGEEKTKTQIDDMIKTYGDGKQLHYQQFFELMVKVFGDADTKEEVVYGFRLINRLPDNHPPVANKQKLSLLLEDQYIDYIFGNAPPLQDGVDYNHWTEWMFAR